MNKSPLEKILDSQMGTLIQADADYEYYATPLESAERLKEEHINQLQDFFKLTELRTQFDRAAELIQELLPDPEIKKEFANSNTHFLQFFKQSKEEEGEKILLLQDVFGFSDETLIKVYTLVHQLVKERNHADAYALLVFLTTLAPHVPSYWIAEGICLQALNRHEDALAVFEGAKLLDPENPAPFAYAIDCYLALKEKDKAKEALKELENTLAQLEGEEKMQWINRMNFYGGAL